MPSSPSSSHWGRAAGQSRQPPPSPGQAAGVCVGSGGSSQAAHAPSTSVRALSHTPPPVPAGPVQRSPQIHSEGSPGTWMRPLSSLPEWGAVPSPEGGSTDPPTPDRSQVPGQGVPGHKGCGVAGEASAQIGRPVPPWARPAVRRRRAVAATGCCGQSQPDPAHQAPPTISQMTLEGPRTTLGPGGHPWSQDLCLPSSPSSQGCCPQARDRDGEGLGCRAAVARGHPRRPLSPSDSHWGPEASGQHRGLMFAHHSTRAAHSCPPHSPVHASQAGVVAGAGRGPWNSNHPGTRVAAPMLPCRGRCAVACPVPAARVTLESMCE